MVNRWIAGLGSVLFVALAACADSSSAGDVGAGTDDIISTQGFSTDCALDVNVDGDTYRGTLGGPFHVDKKNGQLTSDKGTLGINVAREDGSRKFDNKFTVKEGKIIDAENEVFDFVMEDVKFGYELTVHYDGKAKKADVSYPSLPFFKNKKLTFNTTCTFKDAAGNDTTNIKAQPS